MRTAQLIIAVSKARELYEAGDKRGALNALSGIHGDPMPERPEWVASELERRSAAGACGPVPAAARDWVDLARDRLRRELGEDIKFAMVPVRLALNTALDCLGARP